MADTTRMSLPLLEESQSQKEVTINAALQAIDDQAVLLPATPPAYTQTYAIANRTVPAYTTDTESVSYAGIDNAQVGAVYAQLSDLQALRVAYENLRVSHDALLKAVTALIDDLQSSGMVG